MTDVNADVTPTLGTPIQKVDASQWSDMNVAQLNNQLIVLNDRLLMAQQVGNDVILQQIKKGVATLQAYIATRGPAETKLI